MTTIAYRNGVIAADTKVSGGGAKVGTAIKVGKVKGVLYGAAGSLTFMQKFNAWVQGGMTGDPPEPPKEEGEGIVAHGDRILCIEHGGMNHVRADYYATGSGWQFAMGAMAAGAGPEKAVRAAIKHDNGSGGEITVLKA